MATTHQNFNDNATPIGRWEIAFVCGVVLVSLGLRFAFPQRLAVEHFDEGVYASNVWFGESKTKTYPEQHLYAPPALPVMIECIFLLTGPSNLAALLPGLIAGSLTPLALWWLGRNWFGAVTGCVAATLCAMSEAHILLSRSALTDVPFGLWWVLAMYSLREACTSGRFISLILAGGYIGLSWWTKYNGWMPLGIAFGAIVLRELIMLIRRESRIWTLTRSSLKRWIIVSAIALLIWLPWVYALQSVGGYSAVMSNHRRYVAGPTGWWPSLERQFEQLSSLSGPLSAMSILGSLCVATWLKAKIITVRSARAEGISTDFSTGFPTENEAADQPQNADAALRLPVNFSVLATFILVVLGCVWPIIGLAGLGLVALANVARRLLSSTDSIDATSTSDLSCWLLVVWWVGLFLATPLYHPYLRLTVPWLLATFLAAGLCLQTAVELLLRTGASISAVARPSQVAARQAFLISVQTVIDSLTLSSTRRREIPRPSVTRDGPQWLPLRWVTVIGFVAFAVWTIAAFFSTLRNGSEPACFADRTGLRNAALEIKKVVAPAEKKVASISNVAAVYVYAEPALLFQLRLAGVDVVGPTGSLQFADSQRSKHANPTYLAFGIHAKQDPEFVRQFEERRSRFKPIGRWPWHLSPLVSLDQPGSNPRHLGRDPAEFTDVELFELIHD